MRTADYFNQQIKAVIGKCFCGRSLYSKNPGRPRKYCSRKCLRCVKFTPISFGKCSCGKYFVHKRKRKRGKHKKYCSQKCQQQVWERQQRKDFTPISFEKCFCGTLFIPKRGGKPRKYCSQKCVIRAWYKKRESKKFTPISFGKCFCGKFFVLNRNKGGKNRKYCSRKCHQYAWYKEKAYKKFISTSFGKCLCGKKRCSEKCRRQTWERQYKKFTSISFGKCFCGESFIRNGGNRSNRDEGYKKYCSKKCREFHTRWTQELLKWHVDLRLSRLQLALVTVEVRKRQKNCLPHHGAWKSLIAELKREGILPT